MWQSARLSIVLLVACGLFLLLFNVLHNNKYFVDLATTTVRNDFAPRTLILAERFIPTENNNDTTLSWTIPNTLFTNHITTLVDFYKDNYQYCHTPPISPNNQWMNVTVYSPDSVPIFAERIKDMWHRNVFEKIFAPEKKRVLPAGNLTMVFSNGDFNDDTNRCCFANSDAGGHYSTFNMQDIARWGMNETLPSPLPWSQRKAIPVFRGSYWPSPHYLTLAKEEFDHNILIGMVQQQAEDVFFGRVLTHPHHFPPLVLHGHNISALSSKTGSHRRANLVHFSILHPELLNARFHKFRDQGPFMINILKENATNGMHRLLPFDVIPQNEYLTEYQTHVVMGGAGASFRLARIMGQTIAVILQDFPYKEWFTHLMEPYVHYIPLKQDLSDLNRTMQWVRNNPTKVFEIAQNGKQFYNEYLSFEKMEEFYYELIFRLMLCCGGGSHTPGI